MRFDLDEIEDKKDDEAQNDAFTLKFISKNMGNTTVGIS